MQRFWIAALLALTLCPGLAAQTFPDLFRDFFGQSPRRETPAREQKAVEMEYDLIFNWTFLNEEFDGSGTDLFHSGTVAGARLSPYMGIRIDRGREGTHRVLAGVDILKEFGARPTEQGFEADPLLENARLIREFALYYRYDNRFGKTGFSAVLGSFPRVLTGGSYSRLIWSDAAVFYDNNFDGMLLQFRRPRSFYEIALDWNGLYGVDRREEFNVFTSGASGLTPWLSLGWEGMFHHYADSDHAKGVVDDHILHPWVRFDFSEATGLQALRAQAGPVAYYCRDRRYPGHEFRFGGQLETDVRQWNVGLSNTLYYGNDLLPYFSDTDAAGQPFGTGLYMRHPLYRISSDPAGIPGIYDRLSLYWAPEIAEFLSIRLSGSVYFNNGFAGLEQKGTLLLHLDRLGKARKAASSRRPSTRTIQIPL